jgi:hypothetical protein
MNPKLQLSLSLAGAGLALIAQGSMLSGAQAGPSLSVTSSQTYNAGANFNLQQAQTFSVTGNVATSAMIDPFAVTAQSNTTAGATNFPGIAGNLSAGTSTLTAAFDRDSFVDNANNTSLAVQAGVIGIGGNQPTAGVTTASAANGATIVSAGVATNIVFNQNTSSGIPSITVSGAGSNTAVIGASITSQALGASAATGIFTDSQTVINSLTAF